MYCVWVTQLLKILPLACNKIESWIKRRVSLHGKRGANNLSNIFCQLVTSSPCVFAASRFTQKLVGKFDVAPSNKKPLLPPLLILKEIIFLVTCKKKSSLSNNRPYGGGRIVLTEPAPRLLTAPFPFSSLILKIIYHQIWFTLPPFSLLPQHSSLPLPPQYPVLLFPPSLHPIASL